MHKSASTSLPKMEPTTSFTLFTDGGSRGNPGPAAIGVVIKNVKGETVQTYGEYIGETTNNDAEYQAVIVGLKKLKTRTGNDAAARTRVEVYMDSKLVQQQLSDRYKIHEEHIGKLYLAVRNLKLDFSIVTFTHIPREENREADRLVNEALDARDTPRLGL